MTAGGLVAFLVGVFALRMFGGFALSAMIGDSKTWNRLLDLVPMALVAAVVATQVLTTAGRFVVDARVVGITVAAILAARRLPLAVVVVAAAASTAGVRAAGWG